MPKRHLWLTINRRSSDDEAERSRKIDRQEFEDIARHLKSRTVDFVFGSTLTGTVPWRAYTSGHESMESTPALGTQDA
ncbi:Uncharacterised protein [Mycobacteroides abscessus subsp. abscessus]|nr:Uncharacterised protein [Mycobacteroides abscessus subsp. abscessus]SIJ95763.1 Uncharacterised protein [Mycobacteroides abscessus subsp. abscessus]